jgi:hypothetical protein
MGRHSSAGGSRVTGAELLTALRSILDDEGPVYKWKNSALIRYLNEAEVEACVRDRGCPIYDSATTSICSLTISVGVASYALHSRVLGVLRVELASALLPLTQLTVDDAYAIDPAWHSASGLPDGYVIENERAVVFNRMFDSVTSAYLTVTRTPLSAFSDGTVGPEILQEYHNDLLDWALRCAYMKRDPDTQDVRMAQYYEGRFTVRFGNRPSASRSRMHKTMPPYDRARAREFGT